jgi:hypothetical protein
VRGNRKASCAKVCKDDLSELPRLDPRNAEPETLFFEAVPFINQHNRRGPPSWVAGKTRFSL